MERVTVCSTTKIKVMVSVKETFIHVDIGVGYPNKTHAFIVRQVRTTASLVANLPSILNYCHTLNIHTSYLLTYFIRKMQSNAKVLKEMLRPRHYIIYSF